MAYLHSLRGGRSYFLHFRHQSKERDFPQVNIHQIHYFLFLMETVHIGRFDIFLVVFKRYWVDIIELIYMENK